MSGASGTHGMVIYRGLPTHFMVIAHRGASSYAPENTLAAFDLAIQMGVSHIELDVHSTRDDHIVVIHDETVEAGDAAIAQARVMGLTQICPRANAVTPELVRRLHAEGFAVRAWGVATEERMRRVVRRLLRCPVWAVLLLVSAAALAQSNVTPPSDGCGEVVVIGTHDRTTTRYALAHPMGAARAGERIALVLLAGGGGHLDLDDKGCPRALEGNSLVRSLPHFHAAGLVTALVDAPSDHPGPDGLAGFRIMAEHADDLGKVIADVRARTKAPVWLVGSSRGTISAVNAAARLSGPSAPDGLVLMSATMSGGSGRQRPWVAQTVFDVRLEAIRMPVLVVGHAAAACIRSPAGLMGRITARTNGAREQVVTVTGGPGSSAGVPPSVEGCQARSPHGFIEQEATVAAGVARFIRDGSY